MSSQDKQKLYDRIKASTKEAVILEEMKRLGFWKEGVMPTVQEELITKEATLQKSLTDLLAKQRILDNQQNLLKIIHKERMKKAKERRLQTKQKKIEDKKAREIRWKEIQDKEIIYLGEKVSKGLHFKDSNLELLQKFQLPYFENVKVLADALQITTKQLSYWAYNRPVSTHCHYYTFEIPKKSGGKRKIAAPKSELKKLQNWVLHNILDKIPHNEEVHGFVKQKSIVTNALPHLEKQTLVNVDLKDFFPSIHFKRVKGMFISFGYSEQLATIFALLTTQAETKEAIIDGVKYYIQTENRILPQGSPASPAISNCIAYRLDNRLKGIAKRYGFVYTRYADDLTFSCTEENTKNTGALLHYVKKIITTEDFTVHPEKVHVMPKSRQQKVTGIVVNKKMNIDRTKLRQFRALLHNISLHGWKDQQWGKALNIGNSIDGYILFVQMVNPQKAEVFRQQWAQILQKYGWPPLPQKTNPVVEKRTNAQDEKEQEGNNDFWIN